MGAEEPQQVTLSDVIDELTEAQVRRIVALLRLTQPRQTHPVPRVRRAA